MIVIGLDVHKRSVTAVAVDEAGRPLGEKLVIVGSDELLGWAAALGDQRLWAVEDCRQLTRWLERQLVAAGEELVRVPPKLTVPERRAGRMRGKSDPIDALAIARAALREPDLSRPRRDEQVFRDLKLLVDHRDDLVDARRRTQQRLRWHLRALDPTFVVPLRMLGRSSIWSGSASCSPSAARARRGTPPDALPRPRSRAAPRLKEARTAPARHGRRRRARSRRRIRRPGTSRDVAVHLDHRLPVLLGEHARAVGPREQDVVPLRQEADGRRGLGVRQRRSWDVEELAALLVAEAAQRLEQLQCSVDLGHADHAPGADVAARRGAEGREVAAEDLGARLDRDVRLRFLDRDKPSLVARLPERRLGVVDDVRCDARHLPGAARIDAGEAVLARQVGDRLRGRDGSPRLRARAPTGRAAPPARPGERRPDQRIVAPRDEVQRLRVTVALTIADCQSSRSSDLRRNPVVRVQIPTYGACGDCACIPTRRSITAVGESRVRWRRSCRASVARFSSPA